MSAAREMEGEEKEMEDMVGESDAQFPETGSETQKKEKGRDEAKRARSEMDSSNEEVETSEFVTNFLKEESEAKEIEEDIRCFTQSDPSKKMSNEKTNQVMGKIAKLTKKITQMVMKNAYLGGVIQGSRKERQQVLTKIECVSKAQEIGVHKTFAQAPATSTPKRLAPPITGTVRRAPVLSQMAIVTPPLKADGEKQTAEDTKKEIMSTIDPGREKIKVKGVRKRKDGALIIETESADDLAKVLNRQVLLEKGYTTQRSGAINPKVVIFDVPRELDEAQVENDIYCQNQDLLSEITEEEFRTNCIPRFKIGRKDGDSTNWMVEVSPKIRTILRRDDRLRIYLQWRSCKIQDFRGATRCFRCQCYGHVQKFCADREVTCSYCAKQGHNIEDCADKKANKPPICPACKKIKKNHHHALSDKSCPAYKAVQDRIINRTDYGSY